MDVPAPFTHDVVRVQVIDLDRVPHAAVTLAPDGSLVGLNAPAGRLLDGGGPAAVPDWLTEAHRRLSGSGDAADRCCSGPVGDRHVEARPVPESDGSVVWWLLDVTDRVRAERDLREERERSAVLTEVSTALASALNADRCLELTARTAADHLAEAAVVVTPAGGGRHTLALARRDGPVTMTRQAIDPTSLPGLADALAGFPPVTACWIPPGDLPSWALVAELPAPVRSVSVTPLPGHGESAGALVLLRTASRASFTPAEEEFARSFAVRAGAALSSARAFAEQADISSVLTHDLLPPILGPLGGVEYAGAYRAAQDADQVGGDFYDVHPGAGDGDETLVVLGDVAGKGLEAAVLTGRMRSTLQALLPFTGDHGRVLSLLNQSVLISRHNRFATLVLASVRLTPGGVTLRVTSAGHPPPLVVRFDGTVEEVPTRGMAVGVVAQVTSRTAEIVLEPGDTCLLYTDGVTEARGGPFGDEFFGEARLAKVLAECGGMLPRAVVERVQMVVGEWIRGGRHDDIATVAVGAPRTDGSPDAPPEDGT
ncbi:serine/threonine protein phosphatase [Streptomyces sp. WAC 04229]|uniref:PP2C family protein-serine/threonine phosphatase n=1 Tax=Streptomyces sp. WAC 04229 TaxID=2203206 RepID=UPI000F73F184|nr:GAF domain-containing SpoIIE family protein phosphatase [Streptomyces sp. WAC 04229]RSN46950.1 serine/threonine protein phosphatase [Streptomyces sp. WAC 04229]